MSEDISKSDLTTLVSSVVGVNFEKEILGETYSRI